MQVLQRGLLEACVQVSSQTDAEQGFSVSSRIDGFLDTLTELVSSAFALRRHIMSTLRRNLSSRCYALLLIIQVCPKHQVDDSVCKLCPQKSGVPAMDEHEACHLGRDSWK